MKILSEIHKATHQQQLIVINSITVISPKYADLAVQYLKNSQKY